jgi:hypothetical protein
MTIIDTHAHLYAEEFIADVDLVIERAQNKGVSKIYLPAIDSSETESMLALEQKFPGVCIAMMGLHPCYVKENFKEEKRKNLVGFIKVIIAILGFATGLARLLKLNFGINLKFFHDGLALSLLEVILRLTLMYNLI